MSDWRIWEDPLCHPQHPELWEEFPEIEDSFFATYKEEGEYVNECPSYRAQNDGYWADMELLQTYYTKPSELSHYDRAYCRLMHELTPREDWPLSWRKCLREEDLKRYQRLQAATLCYVNHVPLETFVECQRLMGRLGGTREKEIRALWATLARDTNKYFAYSLEKGMQLNMRGDPYQRVSESLSTHH